MTEDARPMSIWQILDMSVRLYRQRFLTVFGASMIIGLAGYVVNRFFVFMVQDYLADIEPAAVGLLDLVPLLIITAGTLALGFMVLFVEVGVLSAVARDAYFGKDSSLWQSMVSVSYGNLLGTALLATLLVGIGIVLLIVPALILSIAFVLAPVIVVAEGLKPSTNLKRSWQLVRMRLPGGFLQNTIVRIAIIWIFVGILNLLSMATVLSVTRAAPNSWKTHRTVSSPAVQWEIPLPRLRPGPQVGIDIFSELVQAFFRPFGVCAILMLYYDVRMRREGLDIDWILSDASPGEEDNL